MKGKRLETMKIRGCVRLFPTLNLFFIGWCIVLFSASCQAQTESDSTKNDFSDQIMIDRDLEAGRIRIEIPAREGKVAWADVLKTLMLVGQLDAKVLEDRLPSGELDLTRPGSAFSIAGLNLWLNPEIRLQRVRGGAGIREHLLIDVDEGAIVAKRRALAREFRKELFARNPELAQLKFGLEFSKSFDEAFAEKPDLRERPVVIVVHGLNSSPKRFQPFVEALTEKGFLSGTFSYPDDQPIEDSAQQLARDLKRIKNEYPQIRIALVTHSMGGLVSRRVIEDPMLDAGNVSHLVMLATPNQGSLLANLTLGFEMFDRVSDENKRDEISTFYRTIEDGMSEALEDLRPDSVFLFRLNQRQRNTRVRYSLFLGTGGLIFPEEMEALRRWWDTAKQESRVVALLAPRVDETLLELDEVVLGKGDGVVAVKRGRLEGVEDTVIADFSHLNVLQGNGRISEDLLFKMVVERLAR